MAAAYIAWLYESSLGPREEKPAASFFSAFDELCRREDMVHVILSAPGAAGLQNAVR
jgi:hypothetical protein